CRGSVNAYQHQSILVNYVNTCIHGLEDGIEVIGPLCSQGGSLLDIGKQPGLFDSHSTLRRNVLRKSKLALTWEIVGVLVVDKSEANTMSSVRCRRCSGCRRCCMTDADHKRNDHYIV